MLVCTPAEMGFTSLDKNVQSTRVSLVEEIRHKENLVFCTVYMIDIPHFLRFK